MSNIVINNLEARIVKGEKNICFIYPVVSASAQRNAVEIFSVELDGHELVPSARGEVIAGENRFELLPVTLVNPSGNHKLTIKNHPSIGAIIQYDITITF